jgi:hypothetical protein
MKDIYPDSLNRPRRINDFSNDYIIKKLKSQVNDDLQIIIKNYINMSIKIITRYHIALAISEQIKADYNSQLRI